MCELGKSTSEVHAFLSETYGTYDLMKSDVGCGINNSERAGRMWKTLKEMVIQEHTNSVKVLKGCGTFFV